MSDLLRPLSLAELRLSADGRRWRVAQSIAGLDSLTPVQGSIQAVHHGTALEVTAEAETIVTLCCDRCLQHYNHRLSFRSHELLWLGEQARQAGLEAEVLLSSEGDRSGLLGLETDELCESIDPSGAFEPEHWVFEQLHLQLPLVNRCGEACPGPPSATGSSPQPIDPRWAALQRLQPPSP